MLVLGTHSFSPIRDFETMDPGWAYHDAAAVLVEDGKVLAAIEEERLNRVKHSNAFPARAIRRCLEEAGKTLDDVDLIAVDFSEANVNQYYLARALENAAHPLGSGRRQVSGLFQREFGQEVADRLRFIDHHRAHLYSAFLPSGFQRGLAVSIDGSGDFLSGAIGTFEGNDLTILREIPQRQSLGFFYREYIGLVGYTRFDEYKVMGLAPYGDASRYADMFAQSYRLLPDGAYEVASLATLLRITQAAGLAHQARRKGEPFNQSHRDFAAGLQQALEKIVMHVLTHFQAETGARSLCMAGGVAHNCSMNGRIAYSGLFDEVWVQPAAHDAGNALGAALAVLHDEGVEMNPQAMKHVYLGTGIPDDGGVEQGLRGWEGLVTFQRSADVERETAALLAQGQVAGWVQGRSEFGPRALGNRSILADPRPAENKDRINAMVKKREGYRPFAPSVRQERAGDYFELPKTSDEFPFMTFALKVREDARTLLGAITHVDGTARVQTVAQDTNPRYWGLLGAFEEHTGVPMLLNTSFNNHAEPIVDSLDEAVTCFLTTGLDFLVVGDWVVRKRGDDARLAGYQGLSPALPSTRKLVMQSGVDGAREYLIESTVNRYFGEKATPISADAFGVLWDADGRRTLGELMPERGISGDERVGRLLKEMEDLWSRRVVTLRPSGAAR
ncbi:carbamoyltransferase family protein [Longimicrobium sp.]|uniref:carbamoyltransferase family protein n=1 Tax=Longimicrobium sp. TaxID=2029185 RepID=UPI002B9EF51E|nr:carbamoyltransferase C-terminal domain-containing protein [Longimicrobium sp.]HSU17574.1 carbamoyltransferase C-terminal domain-containing protein [Longimicrobium sp.]